MEKKGAISIFLVLIILSSILLITGIISYLMIGEIKIARDTGFSSSAYQAADSGVEFALWARKTGIGISEIQDDFIAIIDCPCLNPEESGACDCAGDTCWMCLGSNTCWFPVNDCSYCLDLEEGGGKIVHIKSIGKCKDIRRAIEVSY